MNFRIKNNTKKIIRISSFEKIIWSSILEIKVKMNLKITKNRYKIYIIG